MSIDRIIQSAGAPVGEQEPLLGNQVSIDNVDSDGFSAQEVQSRPPRQAPGYTIDLGGFRLSGLDPSAIKSGELRITLPMKEGTQLFPALYKDAEVLVEEGTRADVLVSVMNNNTTLPVVSSIAVQFDPPLVIDNPKQAFDAPSTNPFLRFIHWDQIADLFVDIVLFGVLFDETGNMHLEGYLDKGCLGKVPLDELMKGKTPQVNSQIGQAMVQGMSGDSDVHLITTPNTPTGEFPDVPALLKKLGAMLERGTYALDVETGDMALDMSILQAVHIVTPSGPVAVHMQGTLQLTANGDIEVTAEQSKSYVNGAMGSVHLGGEVHLGNMASLDPDTLAHVAIAADIGQFHGDMHPTPDVTVGAFQVPEHGIVGGGQLFIRRRPGAQLEMLEATSANVQATLQAQQASLRMGNLATTLPEMGVKADVRAAFSLSQRGFHLESGQGTVAVVTDTPVVDIGETKVRIGAHIDADMQVNRVKVEDAGEHFNALGTIGYTLAPTPELLEQSPEVQVVNRAMDFALNEAGFNTDPVLLDQLSEDVAPFIQFTPQA